MTQDPEGIPAPGDGASTEIPPAFQAAPALSPNGQTDAKLPTAAQQTAQGVAALVQLTAQLPQSIGMMLAQLARAIPRQHVCATCLVTRLKWETAHMTEIKAGIDAAAQAHGIADDDPRRGQLDPAPFMPEHLRPGSAQGIPPVNPAITTIGGTDYCPAHIPGQPGGRTLLIAQGSLSSSLLSQFAA